MYTLGRYTFILILNHQNINVYSGRLLAFKLLLESGLKKQNGMGPAILKQIRFILVGHCSDPASIIYLYFIIWLG